LRSTYTVGAILSAHPVRGTSHIQRRALRAAATTSPPFHNEPHHVLSVKAASCTSWSQDHSVTMGGRAAKHAKLHIVAATTGLPVWLFWGPNFTNPASFQVGWPKNFIWPFVASSQVVWP